MKSDSAANSISEKIILAEKGSKDRAQKQTVHHLPKVLQGTIKIYIQQIETKLL